MYIMFVEQGGSAMLSSMIVSLLPKEVLALENRHLPSQIGSEQVWNFGWVREEHVFGVTLTASDFTP